MTKKHCRRRRSDIKPKFSEVSETYDSYGCAQRYCFELLEEALPEHAETVLDLGCGTGTNTYKLHHRLKSKKTVGVDQALPMIEYAKSRNMDSTIEFIHANIEDYHVKKQVDLILSNASLQWVADGQHIQRLCKEGMGEKTHFVFSVFLPGTFRELSEALNEVFEDTIELPCHSFRDIDGYKDIVTPMFKVCNIQQKKILIAFDSVKELLMSIRKTGVADASNPLFLTPKKLQRLNEKMMKKGCVLGSFDVGIFNCFNENMR